MMRRVGHDPLCLPEYLRDHGFTDVQVVDDAVGQVRPLGAVRDMMVRGALPQLWYGNLWARREG